MSLSGRQVVVTRVPERAGSFARLLESAGARVSFVPTMVIEDPESWSAVDEALERVEQFDWVVLGSQNALTRLAARAERLGVSLAKARFACVGTKTADAVRERFPGSRVLVPEVFRAEALADALVEASAEGLEKQRILFPRAPEGRETLIERLESEGAEVRPIEIYRLAPAPSLSESQLSALESADIITFLSGKTLEFLFEVGPEERIRAALKRAVVAVIGPVAAEAAQELGVRVDVVPKEATIEALVHALGAPL